MTPAYLTTNAAPVETAQRVTPENALSSPAAEYRGAGKPAGRSDEAAAYRGWYCLAIWRKVLRPQRLFNEPLCRFCRSQGRPKAADTVDHVIPHRGDWSLFSDPANLQSLCGDCHTRRKGEIERLGYHTMVDANGYPLDDLHPANQ